MHERSAFVEHTFSSAVTRHWQCCWPVLACGESYGRVLVGPLVPPGLLLLRTGRQHPRGL